MARTFYPLITAQQVKYQLPEINDAIPNELLTQNIQIVQRMNIRPILGYDWYEQLETQTSASTVSTANQYILDEYLYMIISLQVQKRLIMTNSYQLENNGLRTKLSDVSELADTQDLTYYRSDLQNDIDFLINEMIKYIDINQNDYPLFVSKTDPRENVKGTKYNYGFSVGRVENDNCINYGIGKRLY